MPDILAKLSDRVPGVSEFAEVSLCKGPSVLGNALSGTYKDLYSDDWALVLTPQGEYQFYHYVSDSPYVPPDPPDPEEPPPPDPEDPPPSSEQIITRLYALGTFQSRGAGNTSKVAYSQFTRPHTAFNNNFDSTNPSTPAHPSTLAFQPRKLITDDILFFNSTEIFRINSVNTSTHTIAIESLGYNGVDTCYDRHYQWSFETMGQYYAVREGTLYRSTSIGVIAPICTRSRVLSELGLVSYDSQGVRWGGPSEGLIVSDASLYGKELAAGYVRTGVRTIVIFVYNVTDNVILNGTTTITFTSNQAELYFDFITMTFKGSKLVIKTRPQLSSLDTPYWIVSLDLTGAGVKINGSSSIPLGHSSAGLRVDNDQLIDTYYTFTSELFKSMNLSTGGVLTTKAVEGQWGQHLGPTYGIPGFTTYDNDGNGAWELEDGSGGYGLDNGWKPGGYMQLYYDFPTGDVFVIGQRSDINCTEVRYWDYLGAIE